MSGMFWTPEEIKILCQMAEAGAGLKAVAGVLKSRTLHGIRCKAEELGFLLGPRPEVDFEEFERFLRSQKIVKP